MSFFTRGGLFTGRRNLLSGRGAFSSPAPSTGGGLAPYLGQFASRAGVPNGGYSPYSACQSRKALYARSAVTNPIFGFPNWGISGKTSNYGTQYAQFIIPGNLVLTAALEYPAGTYTRLTFNGGATSVTLPGGVLTTAMTDPVAISLPKNVLFYIRTYYTSASGYVLSQAGWGGEGSNGIQDATQLGEAISFATGISDNTMGGTYGANTAQAVYGPCLALAQITAPSVLLLGDSRAHGAFDNPTDLNSEVGNIARSIGPALGYTRLTLGSYQAGHLIGLAGSSYSGITSLAPYFSHVFNELACNDIFAGTPTAAAVLTRLQTLYGLFPGKKIIQSTLEPDTTSPSDNWATPISPYTGTNNQTKGSYSTLLAQTNDLIRASGVQVFDIADFAETSRNSGYWKGDFGVGGYGVADGRHMNQYGYVGLQNSLAVNPALIAR